MKEYLVTSADGKTHVIRAQLMGCLNNDSTTIVFWQDPNGETDYRIVATFSHPLSAYLRESMVSSSQDYSAKGEEEAGPAFR